jgi:hypothetical protein
MRMPPSRGLLMGAAALVVLLPAVLSARARTEPPRRTLTPATICQMIDAVLGTPLPRARAAIRDLDCVKKAYRAGRLAVRVILASSDGKGERRLGLPARRACGTAYRGSDPAWGDHWLMDMHVFQSSADPRIRYSVDLGKLGESDTDPPGATGAQCGASADGYLVEVAGTWVQEGKEDGALLPRPRAATQNSKFNAASRR